MSFIQDVGNTIVFEPLKKTLSSSNGFRRVFRSYSQPQEDCLDLSNVEKTGNIEGQSIKTTSNGSCKNRNKLKKECPHTPSKKKTSEKPSKLQKYWSDFRAKRITTTENNTNLLRKKRMGESGRNEDYPLPLLKGKPFIRKSYFNAGPTTPIYDDEMKKLKEASLAQKFKIPEKPGDPISEGYLDDFSKRKEEYINERRKLSSGGLFPHGKIESDYTTYTPKQSVIPDNQFVQSEVPEKEESEIGEKISSIPIEPLSISKEASKKMEKVDYPESDIDSNYDSDDDFYDAEEGYQPSAIDLKSHIDPEEKSDGKAELFHEAMEYPNIEDVGSEANSMETPPPIPPKSERRFLPGAFPGMNYDIPPLKISKTQHMDKGASTEKPEQGLFELEKNIPPGGLPEFMWNDASTDSTIVESPVEQSIDKFLEEMEQEQTGKGLPERFKDEPDMDDSVSVSSEIFPELETKIPPGGLPKSIWENDDGLFSILYNDILRGSNYHQSEFIEKVDTTPVKKTWYGEAKQPAYRASKFGDWLNSWENLLSGSSIRGKAKAENPKRNNSLPHAAFPWRIGRGN